MGRDALGHGQGLGQCLAGLDEAVDQAGRVGDAVVDFAASPLELPTGPGSTMTLELDGGAGEVIRAEGLVTLAISEFAYFNGRLGFEKFTPSQPLALVDNRGVTARVAATSMLAMRATMPSVPSSDPLSTTRTAATPSHASRRCRQSSTVSALR